ncbi:MFS transporter [Lacticaseibacillus parahuelsenbergensis]|uniref:MFS transporter n=1 Tax=Lacticaseibacillus parahuelsenbergensis TaxID=3068305 RepID=A0ABY9L351_9LACO|nr:MULTISPECIES: MFS transporter [Lacticaseibacillus]MDE3281190.1 MFS transporter [Lacticaseibacillus casei]WLV78119.1 MFS transporter [Lacticaseibacillus sp. NCIMB 15471]
MTTSPVSHRTQLAILSAGLLTFVGILVETSMNVTFPTLIKTLHVSLSTVQWLTSGYLLMVTLVMSTTAFLLRRFNTRSLFRGAVLCALAGTVLCIWAPNFPILFAGRLLQALATGVSTPLMFHLILTLTPQAHLGLYVGMASVVTSLAPALGPTYGGLLTYYASWRMIFWLVLPVILLVWSMGEATIRVKARATDERFDFMGFLLLAVGLFSLIELLDQFTAAGITVAFWIYAVALAVAIIGMGTHLRRTSTPLLNFSLLKHAGIRARAINFFILQFGNIGIAFVIPIFAENVLHTNASVAGLLLLPGSLLGAAVSPIGGALYDRFGAHRLLLISDAAMVVGAMLLGLFTHQLGMALIVGFYLIFRVGFNLGFGNTMSDASTMVDGPAKADINSLFNTLQQYAGSLGTASLSAIITLQQRLAPTGAEATGSQIDFFLLAGLAALTFVIQWRLGDRHQQAV